MNCPTGGSSLRVPLTRRRVFNLRQRSSRSVPQPALSRAREHGYRIDVDDVLCGRYTPLTLTTRDLRAYFSRAAAAKMLRDSTGNFSGKVRESGSTSRIYLIPSGICLSS
jgi:hypothetical protein